MALSSLGSFCEGELSCFSSALFESAFCPGAFDVERKLFGMKAARRWFAVVYLAEILVKFKTDACFPLISGQYFLSHSSTGC